MNAHAGQQPIPNKSFCRGGISVVPVSPGVLACGQWRDDGLVAQGRMRDPQFRQRQPDGLRLPHMAPVNVLADELTDPPRPGLGSRYLTPACGGVTARVLCVLRDPGPKTNGGLGGSGFLSPGERRPYREVVRDAAGRGGHCGQ
jgi:hypothetical protein